MSKYTIEENVLTALQLPHTHIRKMELVLEFDKLPRVKVTYENWPIVVDDEISTTTKHLEYTVNEWVEVAA